MAPWHTSPPVLTVQLCPYLPPEHSSFVTADHNAPPTVLRYQCCHWATSAGPRHKILGRKTTRHLHRKNQKKFQRDLTKSQRQECNSCLSTRFLNYISLVAFYQDDMSPFLLKPLDILWSEPLIDYITWAWWPVALATWLPVRLPGHLVTGLHVIYWLHTRLLTFIH